MGLKVGASSPGQNAGQQDLFQEQCWDKSSYCLGAPMQGPSVSSIASRLSLHSKAVLQAQIERQRNMEFFQLPHFSNEK